MTVIRHIIYPQVKACSPVEGKSRIQCLPIKKKCDRTTKDNLITLCGNEYHNTKSCINYPFGIPFGEGDKIQIQLQLHDFANVDPTNPIIGWGDWVFCKLVKIDGTEITDMDLFSSKRWVGWNGSGSYQVIEIDTSLPNFPKCFSLQFYTVSDEVATINYCSQLFTVAENCDRLITLEGLYDTLDCNGNYYGNFKGNTYSNKISVIGKVTETFPTLTKETKNGNVISSKSERNFKIVLPEKIPQYFINYLTSVIFSANKIKINDELVKISNFAINEKADFKQIYRLEFTYSVECSVKC